MIWGYTPHFRKPTFFFIHIAVSHPGPSKKKRAQRPWHRHRQAAKSTQGSGIEDMILSQNYGDFIIAQEFYTLWLFNIAMENLHF